MPRALVLVVAAAIFLAGCAGQAATTSSSSATAAPTTFTAPAHQAPTSSAAPNQAPSSAPSSSAPPKPDSSSIHGVVVDAAIHPLVANVSLVEKHLVKATSNGAFRFDGLAAGTYTLQVHTAGYRDQALVVETSSDEVRVVMEALPGAVPYNVTVQFHGFIECALEALIITPSCDSIITDPRGLGRPDLAQFNNTSAVVVPMDQEWKTVVTDVVFDGSSQPLLDGLRVTVSGTNQTSHIDSYQQYGRFNGPKSFTFAIKPNGTYDETTAGAVPADVAAFLFNVYPQSLAWHATCPTFCFLGVGTGVNVAFDLYVTTFYGQPAPEGYSFIH